MSKVFMIGGPGNILCGTVDYLLDRNYTIAIFTRNTKEKKGKYSDICFYEGDRSDKDSLEKAFYDFKADLAAAMADAANDVFFNSYKINTK